MKENSIEEITFVENKIKNTRRAFEEVGCHVFFDEDLCKAIEHILSDYKRILKENEKLKALDSSNSKMIANMSKRHFQDREKIRNSIPVQKVKDKIEFLEEEGYWLFTTDRDSDKCVEVLQELLESEERK